MKLGFMNYEALNFIVITYEFQVGYKHNKEGTYALQFVSIPS